MFPGAHATVYRNEDGEPIGWSDESYYEPSDWDMDDYGYDDSFDADEDEDDIDQIPPYCELHEGHPHRIASLACEAYHNEIMGGID
jgi:hypothetical protein